jgi:hypothetical protein
MAVLNRSAQVVWDNKLTGANGASAYAVIGAQQYVAVHVRVDAPTTIGFECAPSDGSSGYNTLPGDSDAHKLLLPNGSGPLTITFAAAGAATIELSPFVSKFVRLTSTNSVNATAVVEVVG